MRFLTIAVIPTIVFLSCTGEAPHAPSDMIVQEDASIDVNAEDVNAEDVNADIADPDLPQGYCNDDADCGSSGACSEGFCVRVDPEEDTAKCSFFGEPPGSACEIHPVTGEVTTVLNAECSDDSDSDDSPYSPRCLYSACTVLELCDDNGECPEPEQTCHDFLNVCFPATGG